MRTYFFCIFVFLELSFFQDCHQEKTIVKKINIDTAVHKECYFFTDSDNDTLKFDRHLKILENTLTDSIVLGHSVLSPHYTGVIEYTMLDNRNDISLDLRYHNPPADRICILPHKEKESRGTLTIEVVISAK